MNGTLPVAQEDSDGAQEARAVAAQRMRSAVRPDEGRSEGPVTRYGIDIPGRIIAAAGADAAQRFVVDPLMTGARLTKEAWEGKPIPDPNLDPDGYRRYVQDVNTAASLGVAGSLPGRMGMPGASMKASTIPAARTARMIEELRAVPKPEPPTGSGFLPAPKTAAEHIEDLEAFAHDDAAREAFWEDRVASVHPRDAEAELERLDQERQEQWDALPDDIRAELEKHMRRLQ
jgi:hypothetical protein